MTAPTGANFFHDFLAGLGIQDSPGAEAALESVRHYEGPNSRYNPLNVIQPEPGSTNFNSVGVQSYANYDTGVQGSVTLFEGSHWAGVRQALAGGNEQQILGAFDSAYTWSPGTNIPALSGSSLNTLSAQSVGPNPGSGTIAGSGTPNAQNADYPGGGLDPLNWPGEAASATVSGIEGIISTLARPFINFVENGFLIVFGAVVILVGLVLLAKAGGSDVTQLGGSSGGGGSSSSSDDDEGSSEPEREGDEPGEGAGAGAGAGVSAEDAAVLA
jgi:hypothetical protein